MDARLLDCETQKQVEVNFDRTLAVVDAKTAANQAESEATTVAALLVDFNLLLGKLKTAGLMTADEE